MNANDDTMVAALLEHLDSNDDAASLFASLADPTPLNAALESGRFTGRLAAGNVRTATSITTAAVRDVDVDTVRRRLRLLFDAAADAGAFAVIVSETGRHVRSEHVRGPLVACLAAAPGLAGELSAALVGAAIWLEERHLRKGRTTAVRTAVTLAWAGAERAWTIAEQWDHVTWATLCAAVDDVAWHGPSSVALWQAAGDSRLGVPVARHLLAGLDAATSDIAATLHADGANVIRAIESAKLLADVT